MLYLTANELRGIAVDPLENRLYIAQARLKVIQSIDFETKTIKTIVDTNLSWPIGIVVDPESR